MSKNSEAKQVSSHHGRWNMGKIFWGLALVAVGVLYLVQNLGIVSLNLQAVWQLWPLIIIAFGLSVLSAQHIVWRIVSLIFTILAIVLVVRFAVSDTPLFEPLQKNEVSINKSNNKIKSAKINLNVGASELRIGSRNQSEIANVKLESDIATLDTQSLFADDIQSISIAMKGNFRFKKSSLKSIFDISLSRSLPVSLDINLGATSADIDVAEAMASSIEIDAGASDLVVKMGDKVAMSSLSIDSGASSILVKVPYSSGVYLKMDGGLVSKNFDGFEKREDDIFATNGYETAVNKIEIDANIGVSKFTIERY